MANVKFHRVRSLPETGTIGHLYFNSSSGIIYLYNGVDFEQFGENYHNRVTSISSSSTNEQYPSAKAVYDIVDEIEEVTATALTDIDNRINDINNKIGNIESVMEFCLTGINT